jgi:hypothetical protein
MVEQTGSPVSHRFVDRFAANNAMKKEVAISRSIVQAATAKL